jgi:hypothetical protein
MDHRAMYTLLSITMPLILFAGIALSLRRSVRIMQSSPEAHENPAVAAMLVASVPHDLQLLLDAEGFRFSKAYSFHSLTFGIWIRISPDPPLRIFCVLKPPAGTIYEFETQFSDDVSLTTSTGRSAFFFPLPFGIFVQCFPSGTPDNLWKAHQQAEEYITSTLAIPLRECRLPFLETFRQQQIRKLSYVTSLRLWVVRGIYWYLVKRFLLHNRPIWRQNISANYAKPTT